MIKKILYHKENKFYWKQGDLHSQFGMIKEDAIKKAKSGSKVKSNIGKEFLVIDASIIDNLETIKRGPAVMIAKDIGWMLATTGIDRESVVLEAGSGSGMLTINLARFCKKVISYEKNKDFYNIAKKNVEDLDMKNIVIKNKDVNNGIDEKNLDAIFLDMLDPWSCLRHSYKALKPAGYIAAYMTNVNQVMHFINELIKHGFLHIRTSELIQRSWIVEDLRVRPETMIIGHTGFISVARKV